MPTKHGLCRTRIYRLYASMKNRCYNPNEKCFKNYGGRGITVCNEWLGENGFVSYYKWAMDNGYSDDKTIDRIDNSKGYSPDNCRWTDKKTQANNRRTNRYIEMNGETHTYIEWCEILGIGRSTVRYREKYLGWDIETALTAPRIPSTEKRKKCYKVNKKE